MSDREKETPLPTGEGAGAPNPPAPFPRREGGATQLPSPSRLPLDTANGSDEVVGQETPPSLGGATWNTASVAAGGLGQGQAAVWARAGRVHPDSAAVVATLDADVRGLLYWSGRDLDASADLDDVVQMLALAQLEAQAAAAPAGPTLRQEAQRHLRRWAWHVRLSRGRQHRMEWNDERMQHVAGPESGPAPMEEVAWDDVVWILGWQDGLAVWLWAVEGWSLSEVSAVQEVTKQQVWRRVRRALTRLRRHLAPLER